MPADPAQAAIHSPSSISATKPYVCSEWDKPPKAEWSVDYGWCRNSLDYHEDRDKVGSSDPRCPQTCPHKAPAGAVAKFQADYSSHGNLVAAENAKRSRG